MSDRERQEALGEVFKLLACDPTDEMKRLAARIFTETRTSGYSCDADEALKTLGLLRYDPEEAEKWGTKGAVYGPVGVTVEPFPRVMAGRGWRWARRRFGSPKCEAKQWGMRGCTCNAWITLHLPALSAGERPEAVSLFCGRHAEAVRGQHPEASVIYGIWEVEAVGA